MTEGQNKSTLFLNWLKVIPEIPIPEKKKSLVPHVLFLLLIALTFIAKSGDLQWSIKGQPNFNYSIFVDEVYKVNHTLNLTRENKMKPSQWLMAKGGAFQNISKISFDIVRGTALKQLFKAVYKVELESQTGKYLFFRILTFICSLLTLLILYKLASELTGNYYIGLTAVFIYSTIFGSTFYSSIFKSDSCLVMAITLLLLSTVLYMKKPTLRRAVFMGALFGFAFAVKYSAIFTMVSVFAAFTVYFLKERKIYFSHLLWSGFAALIAVFITTPYIFIAFIMFLRGLGISTSYQIRANYAFQEWGFRPFAIITHLLSNSMGIVLTLLSVIAVLYMLINILKMKKNYQYFVPIIVYFLLHYVVISSARWLVVRYTMPLYPMFAIFIAILIFETIAYLEKRSKMLKYLGIGTVTILALFQITWFLANNNLLREETPPAKAASWINENIPQDAKILNITIFRKHVLVNGIKQTNVEIITERDIDDMVNDRALSSMLGNFDYLVITERSFRQYYRLKDDLFQPYRRFFDEIFKDTGKYRQIQKFETEAKFFNIKFKKKFLPQDLVIIAPDTYIFKQVSQVPKGIIQD